MWKWMKFIQLHDMLITYSLFYTRGTMIFKKSAQYFSKYVKNFRHVDESRLAIKKFKYELFQL